MMHSDQPLPYTPEPSSTSRRPSSGSARTSGLYGEVVTLPVNRRELVPASESKVF